MFYTSGLSFALAKNPHYLTFYGFVDDHNLSGYVPLGYKKLRTTLLEQEKKHVDGLLKPVKGMLPAKGVTIVSDGWSDSQRRPLINFMVVCKNGPIFIKVVNCASEVKDKEFIAKLIKVIDEVGHLNVVQVVADNAAKCKAAGEIIESFYPHIYRTPCVVHTLNLTLMNICAPKNVDTNREAYNECHWITEVHDEILQIKNFIMIHVMRLSMYSRLTPLKLLSVADTRFASMIIMLRMVGYYSQELLGEDLDRNPPHKDDEISAERKKCFKRLFPNEEEYDKVMDKYAEFSLKMGPFGDYDVMKKKYSMDLMKWWANFGASALNLQGLVLRVLRQPTSSCCERNWGKLNRQRAEDLVFIHNNLHLLSRNTKHYHEGRSKMWDVGGDEFGSLENIGVLEVASISLNKPRMESVLFENDV